MEVQYTVSSAKETGKSNSFKSPVKARAFLFVVVLPLVNVDGFTSPNPRNAIS